MLSSSDDDENKIICPCPVCGQELASMDELWRQIHINGCLTKEQPSMMQRCEIEKCPICGKRLNHLSADIATKHINECMDKQTVQQSSNRKSERCQFCGQCLKGMSERQRKLHDQTCRKSDRIQEVQVIQYPKVVEDLPTPAEWETAQVFHPVFVDTQTVQIQQQNLPLFGKTYNTREIQHIEHLNFSNDPFQLELQGDLDA